MENTVKSLFAALVRHKKVVYAFIVFCVCTVLFASLADEVIENETLPYDEAVLEAIRTTVSHPVLDTIFTIGTDAGGVIGVTIIGLLLGGYFIHKRRWRKVIFLAYALIGTAIVNVILKLIFLRDRPDLWDHLVTENSYSFPSGHAMASSALALSVSMLGWKTKYRWVIIGCATLFALFIGFSRLYLGVHYPTDVIAGWLVSTAWVSTAYYFMRSSHRQK